MSNETNDLRDALKAAEARTNVLENELAKKTELLENTERLLESSQQQYKEMLNRISEMSQQQKDGEDLQEVAELQKQVEISNAQIEKQTSVISQQRAEIESLEVENEKLKRSLQFHTHQSPCSRCCGDEDRIHKSIYELRQAQEDILDLQAANKDLKSQLSMCKRNSKELNSTFSTVFDELCELTNSTRNYPYDDHEMQRKALLDLIRDVKKLVEKRSVKQRKQCCYEDDTYDGYKSRYLSARESLREVSERCGNILNMMGEPTYGRRVVSEPYQRRRYVNDYYGSERRFGNDYCDEQRRFGNDYYDERRRCEDSNVKKEDSYVRTTKSHKHSDERLKEKRKELGECVRELHGITKQIKGDYKELFN